MFLEYQTVLPLAFLTRFIIKHSSVVVTGLYPVATLYKLPPVIAQLLTISAT
jgi:hypothetical protein